MASLMATRVKGVVHSVYPLKYLKKWTPFKIDALGLVTLLGADEVNNSVGRLVRSRYFEYLPLLGAYVVASDAFTEKKPGFQLHNVSKGIVTPDLSGWMTRWLLAQELKQSCSTVEWQVESIPHSYVLDDWIALIIGFTINAGFLAMTVLMKDYWGFVNALSMAISTLVRFYVVRCNRVWLDKAVERLYPTDTKDDVENLEKKKRWELDPKKKEVKMIVILSDAKAVIMYAPGDLVVPCFVNTPKPQNPPETLPRTPSSKDQLLQPHQKPQRGKGSKVRNWPLTRYMLVRWLGWLAFGGHVISLGMSDLVTQLITVAIIVGSTFAITRKWGCDDTRVGTRLRAIIDEYPPEDPERERRIDLYAYLNLEDAEEESLKQWDLIPHPRAVEWWEEWPRKKRLYKGLREKTKESPETRADELKKRIGERDGMTHQPQQQDPGAASASAPLANQNGHI